MCLLCLVPRELLAMRCLVIAWPPGFLHKQYVYVDAALKVPIGGGISLQTISCLAHSRPDIIRLRVMQLQL